MKMRGWRDLRESAPEKLEADLAQAQLLRDGWVTAKTNASIKNAAEFERKSQRRVKLRVKTCGPGGSGFTLGFRPGAKFQTNGFDKDDFTILVRMGVDRQSDDFYAVPTRSPQKLLVAHREHYLGKRKRDGAPRIETPSLPRKQRR
jgi:hypothetical protein